MYLLAVRYLFDDLINRVKKADLAVEDQTVRIGNMILDLDVDARVGEDRAVDATVLDGVVGGNDVGTSLLKRHPPCTMALRPTRTLGLAITLLERMALSWISQVPAILVP